MAQTKQGGQTLRDTMIRKHGSEEAWKAHLREIGSRGGKNGHTGGFASSRELAVRAGRIGGKISKRGKAKI